MNRRDFIKASLTAAAVTGGTLIGTPLLAAAPTANVGRKAGDKKMKILVITGSPRKNSNSGALAAQFIRGAK